MSDRTQPPNWPNARGPWSEVEDISRLFDHGKPWCASATAHPGPEIDYPDPLDHVPWDECRTLSTGFDGARQDLYGPPVGVELYAAAPFQFGALRHEAVRTETRIVLEVYSEESDDDVVRVSLPLGEALRLGRRLGQVVDRVTRLH